MSDAPDPCLELQAGIRKAQVAPQLAGDGTGDDADCGLEEAGDGGDDLGEDLEHGGSLSIGRMRSAPRWARGAGEARSEL